MKGDFSKISFNKKKHFHEVRMQQGRVLLDSDWNEQIDIAAYRTETGTLDIIGQSGAPMHNAGFAISSCDAGGANASPGAQVRIGKGRFYIDGILCENEEDVLFGNQPDFDKTPLPTAAGRYLFYLDVWHRHISVLEDPMIREVALGGPDTTTRMKTVWQVRTALLGSTGTCLDNIPATAISTGQMKARTELPGGSSDPCGLVTGGGYRRLENQLYRVEIHKGGNSRATSTFKWSRENGSIQVKWESFDPANNNNLIVSSTGKDEILGIRSGDWVELVDDKSDLLALPGTMVQVTKVEGNVITINPGGNTITKSNKNPRIRRWEQGSAEVALNTNNNTWLALEDGVEVNFKEGTFKSGDYWLIPARTATADIEWPKDNSNNPLDQSPHGILHHFAKLGIADLQVIAGGAPAWQVVSDCRNLFPPLTELISLYYVGGDGQQAMPGAKLPETLKVGVANGQWGMQGYKVKFEIVSPGAGTLVPASGIITTNANGVAECGLTLGNHPPNTNFSINVKASLLDAAGNIAAGHLPVIFSAGFSMAQNVAYDGGDCNAWPEPKPQNVADALTALCKRSSGGGCERTIGAGGDYPTLADALEDAKFRKEEYLCLCFLPGKDHEIGDIDFASANTKILKIKGCAAMIKFTGEKFALKAREIKLEGLNLRSNNPKNAQITLLAAKISIDQCQFIRRSGEPVIKPYVWIQAPESTSTAGANVNPIRTTLYLQRSNITAEIFSTEKNVVMAAGDALALSEGVEGWIEDNVIEGNVRLQYVEDKFVPLCWLESMRTALENFMQTQADSMNHLESSGALHLHGNTLDNVFSNIYFLINPSEGRKQLMYRNMDISNNLFKGNLNGFLPETSGIGAARTNEKNTPGANPTPGRTREFAREFAINTDNPRLAMLNTFNATMNIAANNINAATNPPVFSIGNYSSFMGEWMSVSGNHFFDPAGPNDHIFGYFLGFMGIFTGNLGSFNDNYHAEAIFNNLIKENNFIYFS